MKIFSQTRYINLLLIIGMIILFFCGMLVNRQIQHIVKANNWVVHTHQVIDSANTALLNLTDAESRLNYFVLTNDRNSIQVVPEILDTAKKNIDSLVNLTLDNVIQNNRVKELQSVAIQKINFIKGIIDPNNISDRNKFLEQATSEKRKELKKNIPKMVTNINQEEINLLVQRNADALSEIKTSNLLLIIFGLFSELLILLSIIVLNYNLYRRSISERRRKKAEKKILSINKSLQMSEERYLLATEGSAAGLWDWEVGTDKVFYSPYFRKMLGYNEKDFPNSLESFEKIIHPQDHDHLWRLIAKHLEKHVPFRTEYRLRTKAGNYRWFQAAGQALWDQKGNATRMSGSVIDIEASKRAEQILNIQHKIAETLSNAKNLEEVSIKIIKIICENLKWNFGALWELNDDKQSLRCVDVWHQYSNRLDDFEKETRKIQLSIGVGIPGRVWKEGQPLWFSNLIHDANFTRAALAKNTGLRTAFGFPIIVKKNILGVIECYTTEVESPDQHILDLMNTIGTQVGQFAKRKTAETKLRESEEYKTAIFKAATDCIITIDENSNIISFNPQTIREFNYTSYELLNKKIKNILPNANLKKIETKNYAEVETEGVRKDGEIFPVEFKASKTLINKKNIFVIIVRNITERKKMEKIKNEFVSVVSHELRTPLTSIHGALGLVLGGALGNIPEKIHNLLSLANNNCDRLLVLISDILDIEKLQSGKMKFDLKVVDLNQLINETILSNEPYAEKYSVKFVLTQTIPNIKVKVDSVRLSQVITNLLSNAAKFSFKNEEITISTKLHQDTVRVLVSNKGPGIPLEFQSHIFQKFSQADSSSTRGKGGTGLGLNISKTIMEKLGGSLDFVSKPNEVTTFYFDLPVWKETKEMVSEQKLKELKDKILICEDDEDQASYIAKLLESSGFKVDISHNVNEAKSLITKNDYHALLLDLILPGQDGISYIRDLRSNEKTRQLPIIVLSSIAQTGRNILQQEAFTVLDWLDKPVDLEKLLRSVKLIKSTPNLKLNILYVEDDPSSYQLISKVLASQANIHSAFTVKEAKEKIEQTKFDLIILDLLLPDGNSEKLIPLISERKIPVIVYSSTQLDDDFKPSVKYELLKSETSSKKLLELVKHVLNEEGTSL